MNNRDYFLSKKYYDDARFPYGFSRSGEFSVSESQAIEGKGAYFKAIESGVLSDLTAEDIRISKVLKGELEASSNRRKGLAEVFEDVSKNASLALRLQED